MSQLVPGDDTMIIGGLIEVNDRERERIAEGAAHRETSRQRRLNRMIILFNQPRAVAKRARRLAKRAKVAAERLAVQKAARASRSAIRRMKRATQAQRVRISAMSQAETNRIMALGTMAVEADIGCPVADAGDSGSVSDALNLENGNDSNSDMDLGCQTNAVLGLLMDEPELEPSQLWAEEVEAELEAEIEEVGTELDVNDAESDAVDAAVRIACPPRFRYGQLWQRGLRFNGEVTGPVELQDIGDRRPCRICGALIWGNESTLSTICCSKGKVQLPPLRSGACSPEELWIVGLFSANTVTGRLFRNYIRPLNNALALSSQIVREVSPPGGGWRPSLVIQGKLYHKMGPLLPSGAEAPSFAQLYVYDPDDEAQVIHTRIGYMSLPASISVEDRQLVYGLLRDLQITLGVCNPYVRDLLHVVELHRESIEQRVFVLNADARPTDEHERRYNRPEGMREIMVITNTSGGLVSAGVIRRDFEVRVNSDGPTRMSLRNFHETHRAFDSIYATVLRI
jgi:hypothetical protein